MGGFISLGKVTLFRQYGAIKPGLNVGDLKELVFIL